MQSSVLQPSLFVLLGFLVSPLSTGHASSAPADGVHPYFNDDVPIEDTPAPAVELISSRGYPTGSTSVSVQLNVTDSNGLNQVILLAQGGLKACQGMNGERDAVVEFDYDGVVPTGPSQSTGLSNPPVHQMIVLAVDAGGNVGQLSFELIDVSTRRNLAATLEGHSGGVGSVAFSPDGATLASGEGDRWTVKLWDVASRTEIATLRGAGPAAFSPDGRTLAFREGYNEIGLWDLATREDIVTLAGHISTVLSVAFSPEGTVVASGSTDGTVRLWDVGSGGETAILGGTEEVNSVSFSFDGKVLASGSEGGAVLLWDVSEWTGPRPAALEIISGNGQQGAPGDTLTQPLIVEVRDQFGNPLTGAVVAFTVTSGGGRSRTPRPRPVPTAGRPQA